MTRLTRTFARLRASREAALLPYLTLGFPAPAATVPLGRALLAAGADGLELGIPSAAPTADGPVLRQVAATARAAGVTTDRALELLAAIRAETAAPLVLLAYWAELHAHGPARLCQEAAAAGADALLVPDAPGDERPALIAACVEAGLAWVPLATLGAPPPSDLDSEVAGFLYCRLRRGRTGARDGLPRGARAALARLRAQAALPVVAGFGLSQPEQVARLAASVDGVVVGSALVQHVRALGTDRGGAAAPQEPAPLPSDAAAPSFAAVQAYIRALKAACRGHAAGDRDGGP
ncbi:MAG: tryptophan synthase subunit alpha [Chloroflexi bacterium]|nr:tryptophan synthase subunit alpha [Chloroflexota bacterium]